MQPQSVMAWRNEESLLPSPLLLSHNSIRFPNEFASVPLEDFSLLHSRPQWGRANEPTKCNLDLV